VLLDSPSWTGTTACPPDFADPQAETGRRLWGNSTRGSTGLMAQSCRFADLPVLTPERGGSVQCRGVVNDAVSIYFLDATLASAFVARWCAGAKDETDGGVYRMRDDEPKPRIGAAPHRIP